MTSKQDAVSFFRSHGAEVHTFELSRETAVLILAQDGFSEISPGLCAKHLAGFHDAEVLLIHGRQVQDDWFERIHELPRLARIRLGATQITDPDILRAAGDKKLIERNLSHTSLTEAVLAHLASSTTLESVYLGGLRFTGTGLKDLARIEELKWVELNACSFADASFSAFESETLQKLQVVQCDFRRVDYRWLRRCPALRDVCLSNQEIGVHDVEVFANVDRLQRLCLQECLLTNDVLRPLRGNRTIEILNLRYNPGLTNSAVATLVRLESLGRLDVRGTSVTQEGISTLRSVIPDVMVQH